MGHCGRYLSVWGPEPHTPPPPPYTLYTVRVYNIGVTGGGMRGGGVRGELNQREAWRLEGQQQFTKLGRKYQHDWLYPQSINADKHLPQTPFTDKLF